MDHLAHKTHTRLVAEGLDFVPAFPQELTERPRAFGLGGEQRAVELIRKRDTRVSPISQTWTSHLYLARDVCAHVKHKTAMGGNVFQK